MAQLAVKCFDVPVLSSSSSLTSLGNLLSQNVFVELNLIEKLTLGEDDKLKHYC